MGVRHGQGRGRLASRMGGIGRRDQLIKFMAEERRTDEHGDSSAHMSEVARALAHVRPVAAREEELYGELRDVRVVLFIFPRIADLRADWRIVWNGREHNIEEIRDPGIVGADMVVKGISGVAQ